MKTLLKTLNPFIVLLVGVLLVTTCVHTFYFYLGIGYIIFSGLWFAELFLEYKGIKIRNLFLGLKEQLPLKRAFKNFFITGNAMGLFSIRSHQREDGKLKVMYNTKDTARIQQRKPLIVWLKKWTNIFQYINAVTVMDIILVKIEITNKKSLNEAFFILQFLQHPNLLLHTNIHNKDILYLVHQHYTTLHLLRSILLVHLLWLVNLANLMVDDKNLHWYTYDYIHNLLIHNHHNNNDFVYVRLMAHSTRLLFFHNHKVLS